jgi:hypothetical protein
MKEFSMVAKVAWIVSAACAVFFALAPQAGAEFIPYGDLDGTHVTYLQVKEESSTGDGSLYSTPQVADDALVFHPTGFHAIANGGGFDFTEGTLTTTVLAKNSSRIDQIVFTERGDWTLLGGSGTAATNAGVGGNLVLNILEIDRVSVSPITVSRSLAFNPFTGNFNLIDHRGNAQPWNGSVTVDLDEAIIAAGRSGRASKVAISLGNNLYAFSEPGTVAQIKKKNVNGVTITAVDLVPEPSTFVLLAVGGLGLALAALRRCRRPQ